MWDILTRLEHGCSATATSAFWLFFVVLVGPTYLSAQSPLFSPAQMPMAAVPLADPTAIRLRYVTIDVDRVRTPDTDTGHDRTLLLNLFPDVTYEAVLDRVDRIGSSFVWVGHIAKRDFSSVTLSVENRTVHGSITVGETVYIVRSVQEEVHAIVQIDPAAFPREKAPTPK